MCVVCVYVVCAVFMWYMWYLHVLSVVYACIVCGVFVCIHMCGCQEQTEARCFPRSLCLMPLRQSPSLKPKLTFWLDWLTGVPREHPVGTCSPPPLHQQHWWDSSAQKARPVLVASSDYEQNIFQTLWLICPVCSILITPEFHCFRKLLFI